MVSAYCTKEYSIHNKPHLYQLVQIRARVIALTLDHTTICKYQVHVLLHDRVTLQHRDLDHSTIYEYQVVLHNRFKGNTYST